MNISYFSCNGFAAEVKRRREEQAKKQADFIHNMSKGKFRGGFILPQDGDFEEALDCFQWDCVNEYRENARAIVALRDPDYGSVILYRINDNEYCVKALIGYTMGQAFKSWDEMKNYCFSWGIFNPPVGDLSNGVRITPEDYIKRLALLDEAMAMKTRPVFPKPEEEKQETVTESEPAKDVADEKTD